MHLIGRYEIERELGRGAMGIVYLGFDPMLKRKIAAKNRAAIRRLRPTSLGDSSKAPDSRSPSRRKLESSKRRSRSRCCIDAR